MSLRTMLLPIDGTEAGRPILDLGFKVAKQFAAHLDVLHVRADPKDAVPLLGEGMSGAMIEEMIEYAEKESRERATRARGMFDEYSSKFSLRVVEGPTSGNEASVAWNEVLGRDNEVVADRGRLADLVVLGRPTPSTDPSLTMVLNAALFETGRPVLAAPPESVATVGKKVAIAWRPTPEAARAIAGALPLLERAESVLVVSPKDESTPATAGPDLAGYLARHGIAATTRAVTPLRRQVGEALMNVCSEEGVDLLVMGAYSHSRIRQLILGGATSYVMSQARIPVFMAH